jgi:hypothetical protein
MFMTGIPGPSPTGRPLHGSGRIESLLESPQQFSHAIRARKAACPASRTA